MRIGIYNRYWTTRGGGERYAGVVAEILSQSHDVELLGPEPVDPNELGEHLGLDLSRTGFRALPAVSERQLSPLTSGYDLFLNCTFWSRLPAQATRSAYLVLFPQKVLPAWITDPLRTAVDWLNSWQPPPAEPLEGFDELDARGSRWSAEKPLLQIPPQAFRRGRARVHFLPATPWRLEEAILDVHAPGLRWWVEDDELVLDRLDTSEGPFRVQLTCRTFVPSEWGISNDRRRLGVCLSSRAASKVRAGLQLLTDRVRGRIDSYDPEIPRSYDLLVSISEFTRTWVLQRWGLNSEVLAPPLDTATFTSPGPESKQKILLSVGRFFHGSHNKKHRQMLQVFRRMCDRGEIPEGWEYHLVGNLHRERLIDLEYFADLERLAEGYPVKLLVGLPLDRLVEEYRRASIFWHAAGWGESERRHPEKLEHFGLTTCEAMSCGCIPVVIAKAGQLEIVENGESGFLFSDARELAAVTRRLIRGHREPWTYEIMERAPVAVQRFGRAEFEDRLLAILRAHDLLR